MRYRIERLVRSGVIRISAIVNPQAVGFSVIGDVLIDVAPGKLQDVAAQLVEFPTVSYVAGSVGEGDLSVQVYARDTEELLRFVNEVIGRFLQSPAPSSRWCRGSSRTSISGRCPWTPLEEGRSIG